jgi:hypothetical protein
VRDEGKLKEEGRRKGKQHVWSDWAGKDRVRVVEGYQGELGRAWEEEEPRDG